MEVPEGEQIHFQGLFDYVDEGLPFLPVQIFEFNSPVKSVPLREIYTVFYETNNT